MINVKYKRPAPSVTMVLVCYNQEKYIKEAVLSALHQDYSPLKIIISDDCSKDRTVSIIEKILETYHGPHEVSFNKNTINQGLINHINLVNSLVDTSLLVVAAGDDISHPNRVTETIEAYRLAENQPTSIYSSVNKMTPDGEVLDIFIPPIEQSGHSTLDCALSGGLIIGASHAWHKSLFTVFGEIKKLGAYEDLVLAYRSSILNGLLYIDKPLVNYRVDVGISNLGTQNLSHIEQFNRYKKIMIPVLEQRLSDSKYITNEKLKKKITFKIKQKINAIHLEDKFFNGTSLIKLAIMSYQSNNLTYFIRLIRKKIKKNLFKISIIPH